MNCIQQRMQNCSKRRDELQQGILESETQLSEFKTNLQTNSTSLPISLPDIRKTSAQWMEE